MAHGGSDHGHYIIPISTLLRVFGTLILLTILTVVSARYIDLGILEVPVALALASTKSVLVVAFFMALKYDSKVNVMVFTVGVLFVGVFLGFTLLDTVFRGDVGNISVDTIREIEQREELLRQREPAPELLRIAPGDVPPDEVETGDPPANGAPDEVEPPVDDDDAATDPADGATDVGGPDNR